MRRVLLIPTIVLMLLGALCYWLSAGAGGGVSGIVRGGEHRPIVFCSADDINTLDPGKMSYMSDIRTAMGLWEGLCSYEPMTLTPIPGVAESWDLSADKSTYTFHLRANAKWSNGEPVTAKDFLFAWKRVLTPSTGADYAELFNCITGVKEYSAAWTDYEKARTKDSSTPLPDFSRVGISSPDPHTIVVHLVIPTAYLLDLMAFPPFYPLHEESMRSFLLNADDPTRGYSGGWTRPPHVVTNGPFCLTDWKIRQSLTLEPNAYYWDRAAVLCDRITIQPIPQDERAALLAYQTGTVDILSFVPQDFGDDLLAAKAREEAQARVSAKARGQWLDVHYRPVFGTYYYVVNCTKPPLDDKRVRKALSLAIHRSQIVDQVTRMHQEPLTLLVPPALIPGYTSPAGPPVDGDVAEARKLLADAGFPEGHNFRAIEILYSTDVPVHGRIAQTIAQMWKKNLGIDVTLRGLERPGFSAARREDHAFDVARGGWYGDYRDPTTWLDLCRSTDGNNDGKFKSAPYDALLEKAANEHDPLRRLTILHDAEQMLVSDELPLIPLYQYGDGMIFDEHKFTGIGVNDRLMTPFKNMHRVP